MPRKHWVIQYLRTSWYFQLSDLIVLIPLLFAAATVRKAAIPNSSQAYMDWYAKKEAQLELVPGFRQLLENMHKDGKRLAIATGKSREGMKRVFNATGIEHLFECVQTADTNFSKPNPGMLLAIADESGLETKDIVMVGDAVLDMQMATNAGSDSVAVSYGASPKERLLETASLGVADNVPQLAAILGLEKYLS